MNEHIQALAHQLACDGNPYCSPIKGVHSAVCQTREQRIVDAMRSIARDCNAERDENYILKSDCGRNIAAVQDAMARECAKIAKGVTNGYTANIRVSEDEQELVRDPDGPWVLNSHVADAILKHYGLTEKR